MKKYFSVIRTKLVDLRAFSVDFYIGLFILPVQILIVYLFWQSTLGQKQVAGFTLNELGLYFLFVQILQMTFSPGIMVTWELWQNINNGNITVWLVKPISYHLYISLQKTMEVLLKLGTAVLIIGLPMLILARHCFIINILAGLFSSIFGFLLLFELHFLIGILTFWVGNVLTLRDNLMNITILLGGQLLPLSMLPKFVQSMSWITPLPYIYYIPAKFFAQNAFSPQIFINSLLAQIIWVTLLAVLIYFVWKKGLSRYSPQGG